MNGVWIAALAVIAALAPAAVLAQPLNLYEWLAISPVVVIGQHVEMDGRYAVFSAQRFLRGDGLPGRILIDLRQANVERNPDVTPRPLRLDQGYSYVALLTVSDRQREDGPRAYRLVRGTKGLRELPAEGQEAFVAALSRCIDIQTHADDREVWTLLHGLIEDTNPLLVEMALDQHLKFQRGEPALLGSLRPLLDHPDAGFRERAARIIGQIVRGAGESLSDTLALRGELLGHARKDSAVPVRVAATEALAEFGGPPTESILLDISRDDPDQAVRYAAERLLEERRPSRPGAGTDPPDHPERIDPGPRGS